MVECQSCGNEYVSLGGHLAKSEGCEYPEITDRQDEIIRGLMLGDGWINHHHDSGNPFFAVGNTNREFLAWINDELNPHSTGVKDATGSDWSKKDYYKVRTMRSPRFGEYLNWYPDSAYEFQEVELTPLVLKMWYVSDGTLHDGPERNPYITLSTHTDIDRQEAFSSMFDPVGVVISRDNGKNIGFTVDASAKMFDYMGESPPGFEHKWPGGCE